MWKIDGVEENHTSCLSESDSCLSERSLILNAWFNADLEQCPAMVSEFVSINTDQYLVFPNKLILYFLCFCSVQSYS